MGLAEHLIDLLVRFAERLEDLAEVSVHEILEQTVVHANCPGQQVIQASSLLFFTMGVAFQRRTPSSMPGIDQSCVDSPFCQKTFNANAKKDNAKAKKGETTGVGICSSDL
jgi:hypothetical protein